MQIGLLGHALANVIGVFVQPWFWAAGSGFGKEAAGLPVLLQETTNQGRANVEAFCYCGGGFAGLSSVEDPLTPIETDRSHRALLGRDRK